MLRPTLLLIAIIALLAAGAVIPVYNNQLFKTTPSLNNPSEEINPGDQRNPGNQTIEIPVKIYIGEKQGRVVFENITRLSIPSNGNIIFKLKQVNNPGNLSIMINGNVILRELNSVDKYTISMPCLYVNNIACYRILVLIPGYDTSLPIKSGKYLVNLELSWYMEDEPNTIELLLVAEITTSGISKLD